jgi:hypothetical protein
VAHGKHGTHGTQGWTAAGMHDGIKPT